jgi:hypothetical protein
MHPVPKIAAFMLTACALPALLTQAGAQSANPACTLLSTAEIRAASGQNYDEGSEGDALGEGLGGGASCQWGGPRFGPGEDQPLLSLVLVPIKKGSMTEWNLKQPARKGCARDKLGGVGEVAYFETCGDRRGPVAYAKAGAWDVVVQMDAEPPATAASVRPAIIAVAKAAAAKARAKP